MNRDRRPPLLRLIGVAIAVSTLAAACGDGEDDKKPTDTPDAGDTSSDAGDTSPRPDADAGGDDTSPDTSIEPDTSPDTSIEPDATPDTSPDTSIEPDTSPDTSIEPDTSPDTTPTPESRVRVLHLSPDAPAVDIYVDDATEPAISALAFPNHTAYTTLDAGAYNFRVTATGSTDTALSIDATLAADTRYTVAAINTLASIQAVALVDDLTPPATGNIRVRIAHGAAGVETVDVLNVTGETPTNLTPNGLAFAADTGFLELPAAAYRVALDVDRDGEGDLVYQLPDVPAGTIATVWAALQGEDVFLVVQLPAGPTIRIDAIAEPPPTSNVRFVHVAPAVGGVDIAVRDTDPLVTDLGYPFATGYAGVPAGTYDLDLLATGTSTVALAVDGVALGADMRYTAFAFGEPGNEANPLSAAVLVDNDLDLDEGEISLRIAHTANGVGTVDLWNVPAEGEATPILEDLAWGDVAEPLTLAADTAYTIGLDATDDGVPEFLFSVPGLDDGTIATVFATLDDDGVALHVLLGDDGGELLRIPGVPYEPPPVEEADVRFIHLSPNAGDVDIAANDALLSEGLAYAEGTDTLTVPAGAYDVAIRAAGTTDVALAVDDLVLADGDSFLAVAYGLAGNEATPLNAMLIETVSPNVEGVTAVIAHTAAGVGQVDLWVLPGEGQPSPLLLDFDYGAQSDPQTLAADSALTVGLDLDNDAIPEFTFAIPGLPAGTVAYLFATIDDGGVAIHASISGDAGPLLRIPGIPWENEGSGDETAEVRFIHLAPFAGEVDIVADGSGAALVEGLAYPANTGFVEVPAGDYDLSIRPSEGTGDGLDLDTLTLMADTRYTAVAFGDLEVLLLDDEETDAGTDEYSLRVVHTAPELGTVDLYVLTEEGFAPLLADFAVGANTGYLALPADAPITVAVDVDQDGFPDYTVDVPGIEAETMITAFAVLDEGGPALYALFGDTPGELVRLDLQGLSWLRVAHLSPWTEYTTEGAGVDLLVFSTTQERGYLMVEGARFTDSTGYVGIPSDTYLAAASVEGGEGQVPGDTKELIPGAFYSLYAFDTVETFELQFFEDTLTAADEETVDFRFIHGGDGIPEVDLWVIDDPLAELLMDVVPAAASGVLSVPAGFYPIGVDIDDDTSTFEVTFDVDLTEAGGAYLNVMAINEGAFFEELAPYLAVHLPNGSLALIRANELEQPEN